MKVHTMFAIAKRNMIENAVSPRPRQRQSRRKPRGEAIADILLSMNERHSS